MVTVGLALALSGARTRIQVHDALALAWDALAAALDRDEPAARALMREAIARALGDRAVTSACAWIALDELRATLTALDEGVDRDARAMAAAIDDEQPTRDARDASEALAVLARWIQQTHRSPSRIDRTIDAIFAALSPPSSHRAARCFDLAQRLLDEPRARAYQWLAARGIDVRGPLAADAVIAPEPRIAALSAYGAHRAKSPVRFEPPTALSMARMIADWTRFASHPRVLFYRYQQHVGRRAWPDALAQIARWPLSIEARAELVRTMDRTPARIVARSLSGGRWACGRCDGEEVRAMRRWSSCDIDELDNVSDDETAGEIEFQCAECELRYWASWDEDTLSTDAPEPEAWSV